MIIIQSDEYYSGIMIPLLAGKWEKQDSEYMFDKCLDLNLRSMITKCLMSSYSVSKLCTEKVNVIISRSSF